MTKDLQTYVRRKIMLWSCVLALTYSAIASMVYLWGIDDATEYAMLKEARQVFEHYDGKQALPVNQYGFKSYYAGYHQLPTTLKNLFPAETLIPDQSQFYQDDVNAIYILPYQKDISGDTFYVVHIYKHLDDDLNPGMPMPELLTILFLSALTLSLIISNHMISGLTKPMLSLASWIASLRDSQTLSEKPVDLKFSELNDIAEQSGQAIFQVMLTTEREKDFLATASHELRTPLAIIFAALDILDKKSIADDLASKLHKIRNASTKMKNLSDSLLWLWRDEKLPQKIEDINIHTLVQSIIADIQTIIQKSTANIHTSIDPEVSLKSNHALLEIAISNLLLNAVKYCHNGEIWVRADKNSFTVINTSKELTHHKDSFGLGLYIVQTIANRQLWGFKTALEPQSTSESKHKQLQKDLPKKIKFTATLYWNNRSAPT